jgi:tetratricopeptide (TPR) repeat protein
MSTTLNLVDALLSKGRLLHELGRPQDAIYVLGRLTGFRELPGDAAENAQALLGAIHLEQRRYRKARRHLTAALRYQPDNPRYHRLMAAALEGDRRGDRDRAAEHYRRSLDLDPNQPGCRADYGLLAVQLGREDIGLRALREAVEQQPTNPCLVDKLAQGLRLVGDTAGARAALLAARFRNPRDPRFRKLWDDQQFRDLHREQEQERREKDRREAEARGPIILPFRRPAPPIPPLESRRIIRIDRPSPVPSPHAPRPTHTPPRRRAQ